MRRSARLVASGVLVGLLATGLPAGADEQFAVALQAAHDAAQAEPLKSYVAAVFTDAFFARFSTWINECTARVGAPFDEFDLLITVGAKGNVERLRYAPKSRQADCFAGQLKAEVLPIPPKPSVVIPAGIRMNKK